jgi:glycerophosphoryl diester phosphodiesterase
VVAHRGASYDVAEHTIDAYMAAVATGADALECDVRLTRDGHLVCVHDRTVNRTSDGVGVVSDLDLDRMAGLDFASWHARNESSPYLDGVSPDRDSRGGVLTLETLLALVRDAERPVQLLIETKHPTRFAGLVEKELVRTLARFGWAGRPGPVSSVRSRPAGDAPGPVTIMSFAPIALRRVRLLAPQLPTVLLLDRLLAVRRDGSLPTGVAVAGPGLELLRADPRYVERVQARGHRVFVWTVDEPGDVNFVLSLGVDAVISNRPAAVLQRLGRTQPGHDPAHLTEN